MQEAPPGPTCQTHPVTDGEMEVIVVITVEAGVATVRLPDTSLEEWSVASLPEDVRPSAMRL